MAKCQSEVAVVRPYSQGSIIPVTTFGDKFPMDDLIRPFLFRYAPMALVSYPYALKMPSKVELPLFLDSGGFAGSLPGAKYDWRGDHFVLKLPDSMEIRPDTLLKRAEAHAQIQVLATLDAFIPPDLEEKERQTRLEWTLKNAEYMVRQRTQAELFLFGSLQAWDYDSAKQGAAEMVRLGVDGIAVGGMIPRARKPEMDEILAGVLAGADGKPVHVFGIGHPELVKKLFAMGVWSVDSSSYVRQSASGRYWHPQQRGYVGLEKLGNPLPCGCPLCSRGLATFRTGGLWGRARLALHNLNG